MQSIPDVDSWPGVIVVLLVTVIGPWVGYKFSAKQSTAQEAVDEPAHKLSRELQAILDFSEDARRDRNEALEHAEELRAKIEATRAEVDEARDQLQKAIKEAKYWRYLFDNAVIGLREYRRLAPDVEVWLHPEIDRAVKESG